MTFIVDDNVCKMKYYFYSGEAVWQERIMYQLNDTVVYLAQCLLYYVYWHIYYRTLSENRQIRPTIPSSTIIVIRYCLSIIQH